MKSNASLSTIGKAPALDPYPSYVYRLLVYFVAWKAVLLVIAASSPGPGYDTSTRLLFHREGSPSASGLGSIIEHAVLRLTRWDGIYYASIAERGCVNEQDWAFCSLWVNHGVSLAKVSSFLSIPPIVTHALVASCIAHVSHCGAIAALFSLTSTILPYTNPKTRDRIAFTAACLHIISPGGLFLSAPNLESVFGLWSFIATQFYVNATAVHYFEGKSGKWPLVVGLMFGVTSTVRSNGILNGVIPLWDLLALLHQQWPSLICIRTISLALPVIIGGSLIGIGFVAPQIPAYLEYCASDRPLRPWCTHFPPSIYSWVQSHYWNVGFFRYWTAGNIPLFLLATPMLCILIWTSWICLFHADAVVDMTNDSFNGQNINDPTNSPSSDLQKSKNRAIEAQKRIWLTCAPRLALPQLLLAILCLTSFHVQIINRLAVAYPMWYIVLAIALHSTSDPDLTNRADGAGDSGKDSRTPIATQKMEKLGLTRGRVKWIVRGMVTYAVVQGGLFASFLPPA